MVGTTRIYKDIAGVRYSHYVRDPDEVERIKKELSLKLARHSFPWGVNGMSQSGKSNDLPPTVFLKTTRKKLRDGTFSEYHKVVVIINRRSLGVYKTFSRRYGTDFTFDEAIDDVIVRATRWWNSSPYASESYKVNTRDV